MATADELLGTIAEVTDDILVIDLNTRVISIPAAIKVLGVESDDDVKRLHFRLPRQYGEFDLSTFDFRVNFKNASGDGDCYPVNDVTVSDDGATISFSWLVDRVAFIRKGDVTFSICMKLYDAAGVVVKELNTAKASLPVLEGLETEQAIVENNPSAFDEILFRLYAVEAASGIGKEGYYSIAKIEETEGAVIVTIINQDGETQAVLRQGTDGADGYTPVKGVDYWTDEDKTEIKTETKNYVDTWAPRPEAITLAAGSWDANTHTIQVTATGVTEDNIIIVAPSPVRTNRVLYNTHRIHCIEQGTDYLKFECDTIPSADIVVNVGVFYSTVLITPTGNYTMITPDEVTAMFNS